MTCFIPIIVVMLVWAVDTGTYALSILDTVDDVQIVKHYHVRNMDDGRCYVSCKATFNTLDDMVKFYSGKCTPVY